MNRVNNGTATPGGYSDTGNTTISSPVITGLGSTGGINPGDYVLVSAGFEDIGRIRVLSKTVNTITLNRNAQSTQSGVTVTSQSKMYTDGIADTIARTVLNSLYMNQIQEELINLIEKGGLSPDESNLKQLAFSVITRTGGIMVGDLDIAAALIVNSLGLHKTVTGTGADSTDDIKVKGGGIFTINSLAANSNVSLFEFGSSFDGKEFYIDVHIRYTFPGQIRQAHWRGLTKTGVVSPTGIHILAPQYGIYAQNSDTPVNLGGFYINYNTTNDSDLDGTTAKNGVPFLVMRQDKIDLRNSYNSGPITNIEARIKTSGLI